MVTGKGRTPVLQHAYMTATGRRFGPAARWKPSCDGGNRHHVAGPYLVRYAQESAWREDKCRVSNEDQVQRAVQLALASRPSPDFCGYLQRHRAAT